MSEVDLKFDKDIIEENAGNNPLAKGISIFLIFCFAFLVGYLVRDSGLRISTSSISGLVGSNDAQAIDRYSDEEQKEIIDSNAYDFELYQDVVANLKQKYVDDEKIDDQKLFEGSIKGMVNALDDNATVYFDSDEFQAFKDSFSGQFEGIGVRLDYESNRVVIVEVLEGSPAMDAQLRNGWIFYTVDGEDVSDKTIEYIVSKVRGEAGSTVKIVFLDPETGQELEKEIVRQAVTVDSMRLKEINNETVVFEVSRFTETSIGVWNAKWDEKVREIQNKGYNNVILDLRGNGGGYLNAAIKAAGDFLEEGDLIVKEKSRIRDDIDNKADGDAQRLRDKNIVILMNGGTASASEILTGAIKFHNPEVKIIGTESFGKGTVQNTYEVQETGGALKITTEYWILPNGNRLDKENPIQPDIYLELDDEARQNGEDNVLDRALEELGVQ